MDRVAIVTGGNRGLGLECVKQLAKSGYQVILTARDRDKGKALAGQLTSEGLKVTFTALDISSSESIKNFAKGLGGRVDVLVNNAGIYLDERSGGSALSMDPGLVLQTFRTNVLGAFELSQLIIPLMEKNKYGRVVNVSSGMGQLSEMGPGSAAYRVSKTALNAVTKVFAAECTGKNILINSVCPGWVRTDMGGAEATRSLDEGTKSILWAATLPDDGPTGGFFRDGKSLDW